MEDLLASIRRAIGEEGVDLPELPRPALGRALAQSHAVRRGSRATFRRSAAATGGSRERPGSCRERRAVSEQPAPSSDIRELRGKIGKELMANRRCPAWPRRGRRPLRRPALFRGILSGREERSRRAPTCRRAPVNDASPTLPRAAHRFRSKKRRHSCAPEDGPLHRSAGRRDAPCAFDTPVRGVDGSRPPYGNGSFGVHGFSPPGHRTEPGMMSAESSSLASRRLRQARRRSAVANARSTI